MTVPRLASSLAACGTKSYLATLNYEMHGAQTDAEGVDVISVKAGLTTRRLRGWSRTFRSELISLAGEGLDIIHNHGVWMLPNLYARQAATGANIPLVISPRGMLEGWSLKRSRLRKSIAWHLFETSNLRAARLFHATSEEEAESLRALGLRQPIAVVPNGIDTPIRSASPSRGILESKFPELVGKSWLLFLSRLHEKKGVAELLNVWSALSQRFPDWHLVIAGPDLDGYGQTMRRKAAELRISRKVTFTGGLDGDDKACALSNAELFVLPTHSENFGVVVAEALAHETPVVTTKGAPWKSLSEHGCGWWIEMCERELLAVLEGAMRLSVEERHEMGARGRKLVEKRFSWERVGEDMLAAYLWVAGRAPRPTTVVL